MNDYLMMSVDADHCRQAMTDPDEARPLRETGEDSDGLGGPVEEDAIGGAVSNCC